MKSTLKISLKAGEKIYVNGAVIRAERKTSLEFLNDVQFLLEAHVLQVEDANTPLRQLYFIVQIMLMNHHVSDETRDMFRKSVSMLLDGFENAAIRSGLKAIDRLVGEGHFFDALRSIRALYPLEAMALRGAPAAVAETSDPFPYKRAVGE